MIRLRGRLLNKFPGADEVWRSKLVPKNFRRRQFFIELKVLPLSVITVMQGTETESREYALGYTTGGVSL